MAFTLNSRKVCYRTLEEASGLSSKDFKAFWEHVREELFEPANRVGYLGPYKSTLDVYRKWLDDFVSGGIGQLGWGNGVTAWNYGCEEDQADIKRFVQQLVRYMACDCRRTERRRSLAARVAAARQAISRVPETSSGTGTRSGNRPGTRAGTRARLREMQGKISASVTASASPHPSEASLTSAAASGIGQGYKVPSELPGSAKVISVNKTSTTFAEFTEIVARECPRPKSRAASAVAGIRVFWGSRGEFIDVTEGSSWGQVKELLSEAADTPGLAISVEFD